MQSVLAACARPDPKLDHDDDLICCLMVCITACKQQEHRKRRTADGDSAGPRSALQRGLVARVPLHQPTPAALRVACVEYFSGYTYDGGVVYGVQHYHGTHTVRPAGSTAAAKHHVNVNCSCRGPCELFIAKRLAL